jgi:hypothetical protein
MARVWRPATEVPVRLSGVMTSPSAEKTTSITASSGNGL